MRIQLHSKRVQTSITEAFLQALEAQLTGKVMIVIAICLPSSQDQPIVEPVPEKQALQRIEEKLDAEHALPIIDPERGANCPQQVNAHTSPAGSEENAPELVGQVVCWKRESAGPPKE